jgi:hypothetical protein
MNILTKKTITLILAIGFLFSACASSPTQEITTSNATITNQPESESEPEWREEFDFSDCTMSTEGKNDYFILEPGFQLVLEGGNEVLTITVLDETIEIDGTMTRVVEEREWRNGEIIEVSRNFFAICEETKDVFYYGEEVDMYSGGVLSSHSGAWRAGEENATAGLIMPGKPVVGMKYYQEVAPGVAMDRAEVISVDDTISTPTGDFPNTLLTKEGTALNLLEREFKTYAPGIGLIQDQILLLTKYGFIDSE